MKKIFIHCGLHKTGTTSIQNFLFSNPSLLKKNNFLYPLIGIPESNRAHHNFGWELSGDERFNKSNGTIEELKEKIKYIDQDIILSTESFETILNDVDTLEFLKTTFEDINFQTSFVIFIRNPIDYLISCYLQLLKNKRILLAEPFDLIMNKVIKNSFLQINNNKYYFNYHDLFNLLNRRFDVLFQIYDSSTKFDSIHSFMSLLNIEMGNLSSLKRLNVSPSNLNLFTFFYHNIMKKRQMNSDIRFIILINLFKKYFDYELSLDGLKRSEFTSYFRKTFDYYGFNQELTINNNFISINRLFSYHSVDFLNSFVDKIKIKSNQFSINLSQNEIKEITNYFEKIKI